MRRVLRRNHGESKRARGETLRRSPLARAVASVRLLKYPSQSDRTCPLWPWHAGASLFSDCSSPSRAFQRSLLRLRRRQPAWSAARATSRRVFRGATNASVPASSARSATRRTGGSDSSAPLPATSGGDEGPSLDQAVQDPGRERHALAARARRDRRRRARPCVVARVVVLAARQGALLPPPAAPAVALVFVTLGCSRPGNGYTRPRAGRRAGAFRAGLVSAGMDRGRACASGARDARMTDTDSVAVTVAAESSAHANELVRALLGRAGASEVAIVDPALVGQR